MFFVPAAWIQESRKMLDGGEARLPVAHFTAELAVCCSQLTPLERRHGRRRRRSVDLKQGGTVTPVAQTITGYAVPVIIVFVIDLYEISFHQDPEKYVC